MVNLLLPLLYKTVADKDDMDLQVARIHADSNILIVRDNLNSSDGRLSPRTTEG